MPGKKEIDDPGFRDELAQRIETETGIRMIGSIPEEVFREATVVLSNYIGMEEGDTPFLVPTINGIAYFACEVSKYSQVNRLIAVGRENALACLDEEIAKALAPALVEVTMQEGKFRAGTRQGRRMKGHLGGSGVLILPPAATTEDDGWRYNLRTGGVRLAMEGDHLLGVLAMEAPFEGEERVVTALHFEQISIPKVTCEFGLGIKEKLIPGVRRRRKSLLKQANYAIALYTMATGASLLHDEQLRGEFTDPEEVKERAKYILLGMERDGLYAEGGFLLS